ncbi:hypothetical protein OROMI_009309 [Orobanche minor]
MWSMLEVSMPGIFETGDVDLKKLLNAEDRDLIGRMRSILGSFILRRLKSDVMQQLVPKMQKIEYVRMKKHQQDAYNESIENYRASSQARMMKSSETCLHDVARILPRRQISNYFLEFHKKNHLLLVRRIYSDNDVVHFAKILHPKGAFGFECTVERVIEELKSYNDFYIHRELWSMLEFLMPGIFETGDVDLKKLLNAEDRDLIGRMRSILGPFILRRLKSDVMQQLVPKMQKVHLVFHLLLLTFGYLMGGLHDFFLERCLDAAVPLYVELMAGTNNKLYYCATIVDQVVIITPAANYVPELEIREVRIVDNTMSMSQDNTSTAAEGKMSPNNGRVYVSKAQDVVSIVLAKGSAIGQDAVNQAKAFDEKHRLTANASARVVSFDRKINDTRSAVKSSRYVTAGTSWLNGAFTKVAIVGHVAGIKT